VPTAPAEIEYTIASVPMSRVHWLSFEEMSVLNPAVERALFTRYATTINSGLSEASGASHWIMKNSGMPYWSPNCSSPSAKGEPR